MILFSQKLLNLKIEGIGNFTDMALFFVADIEGNTKFGNSRPELFYEKVFWKYTANLQENSHAEVWFQATLLNLHFGMGVLL